MEGDEAGQGLGEIPQPTVLQAGNKVRDLPGITGAGDDAGERIPFLALYKALLAEKRRLVQLGINAGAAQAIGRFY